jgi:hypothetical protein
MAVEAKQPHIQQGDFRAIPMDELLELEQKGWKSLSSDGDAGRRFYASVLRHDAVMLFPGGMHIEGREKILESLVSSTYVREQTWKLVLHQQSPA